MFMAYSEPHNFTDLRRPFSIEAIQRGLEECVEHALSCGVRADQIILDTGMGAFLSPNADDSWSVIEHYQRFSRLGFELLLGCSRKGFLKLKPDTTTLELDKLSALAVLKAVANAGGSAPAWVRVHNVAIHKAFFEGADFLEL